MNPSDQKIIPSMAPGCDGNESLNQKINISNMWCMTPESKVTRPPTPQSPYMKVLKTSQTSEPVVYGVGSASHIFSPSVHAMPPNSDLIYSPNNHLQGSHHHNYYSTPHDRSLCYSSNEVSGCTDVSRTPKGDKNSKGLRHFSMKVLQKVQSKEVTTYNEVADELVREFGSKEHGNEQPSYDHKNIRRRVYDALNVLMAVNIIHKEKKEIKWVGLPTNSMQELQHIEETRNQLVQTVRHKIRSFRDLITQEICLKNLVAYNETKENKELDLAQKYKIELPFVAITTGIHTTVDCCVTASRDDYYFSFESPFDIHDEFEVMKRLGYTNGIDKEFKCSREKINQCKASLPRSLHPYIDAIVCCSSEEFEEFILKHRHFLLPNNLEHLPPNVLFVNKLIESCQTRSDVKNASFSKAPLSIPNAPLSSFNAADSHASKNSSPRVVERTSGLIARTASTSVVDL